MTKNEIKVRPHVLYIFTLLYPYLTLLIIPVIKETIGFIIFKDANFSELFTAEVTVLITAFILAWLKYKRTVLVLGDKITVQKGLFCRINYTLPKEKPRVIALESNLLFRPFGVYRLKIYTEGGVRKKADESLIINRKTAFDIYNLLGVSGQAVRSNTFGNVLMSAALSSSVAGWLLAMPIVKIITNILGGGINSWMPRLKSAAEIAEIFLSFGKYIPLVLAVGYIVSFFVLLLKNSGFSSVKSKDKIMLVSGRFSHRTLILKEEDVKALKTVTAPLMLLAGKSAVKFSACGFGRAKGEIGLLVPCVKPSIANGLGQWLLPKLYCDSDGLRPQKKAKRRAVFMPLAILSVINLMSFVLADVFKNIKSIICIISLLLSAVLLIYGTIRFIAASVGRFAVDGNTAKIKYRQGFKISEITFKKQNIRTVRVFTTLFDRRHKQCSVKIYLFGKNQDRAVLKYLNYNEVQSLLKSNL